MKQLTLSSRSTAFAEEGMDCQHSLMEEIEQVTEMFKILAEAAQKLDQSR